MEYDRDMGEMPVETIEIEITTLVGQLNAGNYRFLMLLGEFDERHGYEGDGMQSCAHWLVWRCGFAMGTAKEKVRVARALRVMPKIREAMQRGALSYCMVRAITRGDTAESEETLLKIAQEGTVSHVEKTLRLRRRGQGTEELERQNARHASRYLQMYVAEDGCLVLNGILSPEQGARVRAALLAGEEALREAQGDSGDSCETPHVARCADALEWMAERALAGGQAPLSGGERHLVHVHVDEQVLRDSTAEGRCEIEEHSAIAPATVKRLCCDGSLIAVVEDAAGRPLSIGRKTRAVPVPLRRAVEMRDGGCRFPGCCNTRYVDAHHIRHWIHGGETKLENLVLLCRRHHRFLHEYGYRAVREDGRVRFERPDGTIVETVAPVSRRAA
jgi:hypothetical protein